MYTLSLRTLNDLPSAVSRPQYGRGDLSPGILHVGVGNFHRAHQAVYLDALFNLGQSRNFAIVGAGVRATDADMRKKLLAQDLLTTVVEQEATSSQARVTGAMIDFVEPGDTQAILAKLADPAIRIVSMTVTEGGYYIDPATQAFNPHHPDIAFDAAHVEAPKTVFGLILAGLKRRRDRNIVPFTVLSCDNIPHNGRVTKNAIGGLAELVDADLARYIESGAVAFPNSMVDRITPATTDRERQLLAQNFAIEDQWPVFCESFKQWVIEDHFSAGRPALEDVGVEFVPDVAPFELMKIRILNGGHATIAYPAALMDLMYVHEAMENSLVRRFLSKVEHDEIIPIVPPVPGTDLATYFEIVERRFANPKIGDTIQRLCFDGSNRQPKFILPSVRDRLGIGGRVEGLALVSALWCRYCHGQTDSGKAIAANDESWARLTDRAKVAKERPQAWLDMPDIYGELARSEIFVAAFSAALRSLWSIGVAATLERYVGGSAI